ncbi:uncharacterized protein LOC130752063 [Actinidia eriantha]|uniref:uncharacterized protein LOC130752063 n=1 Tax=Actinidia eriantha TaxID=165200 RepID=UPI00258CA972|nr:uncharacterized protein LOC130752063 [Actinidia eriantha]
MIQWAILLHSSTYTDTRSSAPDLPELRNRNRNCNRNLLEAQCNDLNYKGLAFRGHDESEVSDNRGNFLELLEFLSNHNNEVEVIVLKNAPENLKHECFSILVDESCDTSIKEQMAVVVRYVNIEGYVIESFLSLEHVTSTTAISLKEVIKILFLRHKLSISKLRGQGYDGDSNMRREFNGLKTLILKENQTSYYVHCFAHQLQLVLVAVTKKHYDVLWFFNLISNVLNVVGGSYQLNSYEYDMRYSSEFEGLKGLGELAQKMVETKKSGVYPLIYRLLKLALVLPVATTSVERDFSVMKIVKNHLRNRMGDQLLNDSWIIYIEKKRFKEISNYAIIVRFQKMKSRCGQL